MVLFGQPLLPLARRSRRLPFDLELGYNLDDARVKAAVALTDGEV